jgi:hypothetical protein
MGRARHGGTDYAESTEPEFQGQGSVVTSAEAVVRRFREAVAIGEPWFEALLRAVHDWRLPEEDALGRHFRYLIDGEAFDWLALAERLLDEVADLVPLDEVEALLFAGQPPIELDEEKFREAIGAGKHRAHLSFVYGVTVEEALQLAVEEEVHKERRSNALGGTIRLHEAVFDRLYHRRLGDLLAEFREARGLASLPEIRYQERKEFTYWLFKYRLSQHDRARVASDTRKGLAQLSHLELACKRRRSALDGPAEEPGEWLDGLARVIDG